MKLSIFHHAVLVLQLYVLFLIYLCIKCILEGVLQPLHASPYYKRKLHLVGTLNGSFFKIVNNLYINGKYTISTKLTIMTISISSQVRK